MKHIGRKLYHLLGGIGLLSLYYVLGRGTAIPVYAGLFLLVLAADILRLKVPAVNRFVFERFGSFIRKNEENRLTGTPPYILGIALSLYFFSIEIATAAVCFLAFGDVAATAVGERWGRTKIGEKSIEGTAAFVAAAVFSGFLLQLAGVQVMHGVLIVGAIAAAGVELVSLRINDNLMIPLVSGAVMTLVSRFTGCA